MESYYLEFETHVYDGSGYGITLFVWGNYTPGFPPEFDYRAELLDGTKYIPNIDQDTDILRAATRKYLRDHDCEDQYERIMENRAQNDMIDRETT